jgi:amino acid adenylation domain-containing protein
LLTQTALRDRLPAATLPTLVLDDQATAAALAQYPDRDIDARAIGLTPQHLAYVIYTSGSTGKPKGVANQHDGVVNRLLWAQSEYRLNRNDRVLQKTPIGFDVSVWEFFLPLMNGASLVLARPNGHQDPAYLLQCINDNAVTITHFVPSMLQVFLELAYEASLPTLRVVKCSGEALPRTLVRRFQKLFPRIALHNLYGPTEAAVDVTYHACLGDSALSVPIGRPIANARLYILDSRGEPAPIGMTGEIYIGGAGVARGYLNRPELTAERFLADPFHGGRMYKTGDLGRWLPDGSVEYLGRNDFQVKIRGFRIELGEIEAKVCAIAGVREAVVVARDDGAEKRLVAYVVSDAPLEVAALRSRLAAELPEHMLPSAFVALAAFPLTPNGKLDRAALPEPGTPVQDRHRSIAPRNATEAAIATIWTELLGLDHVGIHDNFFDLGGHSLKAATATFRINNRISGNQISLVDFYRTPTIEALAARIDTQETESDVLQRLTRAHDDNNLALICCPYAGASAAVFQPLAEQLAQRGMPIEVYAITIPGNEVGTKADASQSVESIATACVERILGSITGTIALYGHCVGSYLALEITRQLELVGREVQFLAVGGAFPATRFGRLLLGQDLWGAKGDREIHALIQSWGGPSDSIDDDMLRFMMDNFRRDSRMAAQYERRRKRWRIAAPIHCIVGTNDKLTPGYHNHYRRWGDISENVSLETIADAEHYFVGTHPEEVATILSAAVERVLVKKLFSFSAA